MPAVSVFFDTNVLFYIRDTRDQSKSNRAVDWFRSLARDRKARANLQVKNELTNALLRRRPELSDEDVFRLVDELQFLGESPIGPATVRLARTLRARYRYSWWDCLLLASALELECTHFLSEDLQDGQSIADGRRTLTIINPFAHSPEHILIQ